VEWGRRITLRHVLTHMSGLPPGGKNYGSRDPDALRRFIWEELARSPIRHEPGTIHWYSNTAFCLSAYLAEVVTGRYFQELVAAMVFEPLEMRRSTFD